MEKWSICGCILFCSEEYKSQSSDGVITTTASITDGTFTQFLQARLLAVANNCRFNVAREIVFSVVTGERVIAFGSGQYCTSSSGLRRLVSRLRENVTAFYTG
ncbi:hypothetical protein J6590_005800 [Homalodisca vitripennis]|nr:hypothetical protein J6590_005800 [Homalodisca vitripennis]